MADAFTVTLHVAEKSINVLCACLASHGWAVQVSRYKKTRALTPVLRGGRNQRACRALQCFWQAHGRCSGSTDIAGSRQLAARHTA